MSASVSPGKYEAERMRLYFLGGLPAAERSAMQDRMFRDAEFFARMRLAEIDLIDACAGGWLPADSIEPARRFFAEASRVEAFAASAGLAAALRDQEPGENWFDKLRQRFS